MNIEYIIPIVTFWHTITTEIMKYQPPSIANNLVSFIHCITFIGHYNYDYNVEYAVHISIGFYAYDLFFIFSQMYGFRSRATLTVTATAITNMKTEFKKYTPFIAHHIVGIYLLYASLAGESKHHILGGYNILEKSNIMLYISYYLHKEYHGYPKLNALSNCIQFLIYSYYRVVSMSFFLYENTTAFLQFHYMTQVMIIILYCMGFEWSYKLFQKNIKFYHGLNVDKSE
jgi:hypothetical protein